MGPCVIDCSSSNNSKVRTWKDASQEKGMGKAKYRAIVKIAYPEDVIPCYVLQISFDNKEWFDYGWPMASLDLVKENLKRIREEGKVIKLK